MYIDVTISNTHERGFAFAIAENGDQMFIPPHVADGHDLQRGNTITAQAAINPSEVQRANTKWVALNLAPEQPATTEVQPVAEPEVEVQPTETLSIEQRDELVYGFKRANTKWVALNLAPEQPATTEVQPVAEVQPVEQQSEQLSIEQRDELVYGFICDGPYATTAEISRCTGLDHKTAGNSALRLFNSGLIAKADVYNRVGQQRSSVTLWADSAASFLGDDQ